MEGMRCTLQSEGQKQPLIKRIGTSSLFTLIEDYERRKTRISSKLGREKPDGFIKQAINEKLKGRSDMFYYLYFTSLLLTAIYRKIRF